MKQKLLTIIGVVLPLAALSQISSLNTTAKSLDAQMGTANIEKLQVADQLRKCHISAPASGTVLEKYCEAGEFAVAGKPLFKIADVDDFKADLIVEIPHGYEKDIALGKTPQVLIAANAVNGTKGSMGNAYMSSIAAMNLDQDVAELQSKVSSLYLYNKHLNYKLFMIPSLVAILVMLMCGFLPALNIVSEKGTIEAINVTPVGKFTFILGKLIPYWIIALVVMSVCLVIAWLLYGITSAGNLGLVYMLAMLLALFFSGFGILVSNCNDTMQQAVFVIWFTVVCLMLLSGLFTPVRSMPQWAYATTYVNPMHYFIDAIRTVFVRGGDFHSIAHQAGTLAVAAIVINSLAMASYCKNS